MTDANVVLGHLPPRLLGGEMELDVDAAHAAVGALASQLGLDVHAAAAGIVDIVNESMLGALRVVTVQKGLPPTEFALVSFGGAGGLHANALAALLGCFPVLVPPESGVLSALGFVAAEIKNEFSQTYIRDAEAIDGDELRARLAALAQQADQWLEGERVEATERSVDYVVDMRYQRQGFEIPIDISAGELAELTIPALTERFDAVHHRLYGFGLAGGAELVSLRAVARGGSRSPQIPSHDSGPADPSSAQDGTHTVWAGGTPQEVPTYARAELRAGMRIQGYAIVEQYDATTIVLPGHAATVDHHLNLLIAPEAG